MRSKYVRQGLQSVLMLFSACFSLEHLRTTSILPMTFAVAKFLQLGLATLRRRVEPTLKT